MNFSLVVGAEAHTSRRSSDPLLRLTSQPGPGTPTARAARGPSAEVRQQFKSTTHVHHCCYRRSNKNTKLTEIHYLLYSRGLKPRGRPYYVYTPKLNVGSSHSVTRTCVKLKHPHNVFSVGQQPALCNIIFPFSAPVFVLAVLCDQIDSCLSKPPGLCAHVGPHDSMWIHEGASPHGST